MTGTDDRLDEIEARADAATPGPWEIFRYGNGGGRIHLSGEHGYSRTLIADVEGEPDSVATVYNEGDREFLFHARKDVPWLCSQLRDAQAEVERLRSGYVDHVLTRERDQLRAELAAERAKVQRVEALCEEFERWPSGPSYAVTARGVRAALAGGEQGE